MTKMTYIFDRQGVNPQSEENWGEYAKAKQARRDKNLAAAHEVLTRNEIQYEELENQVFRVHKGTTTILYHPPTGEWRDGEHIGYGVRNLVRYIKGDVK